jgi:hypothetical protein
MCEISTPVLCDPAEESLGRLSSCAAIHLGLRTNPLGGTPRQWPLGFQCYTLIRRLGRRLWVDVRGPGLYKNGSAITAIPCYDAASVRHVGPRDITCANDPRVDESPEEARTRHSCRGEREGSSKRSTHPREHLAVIRIFDYKTQG